MTVGATTSLTALWALGTLLGLGLAARLLGRDYDPNRLAGFGVVPGLIAFRRCRPRRARSGRRRCLALAVVGVGFGGGLFAVGTLTAAMALSPGSSRAASRGSRSAPGVPSRRRAPVSRSPSPASSATRSRHAAARGDLGSALTGPASAYSALYCLEIVLLFATLVAIGPLARGRPLSEQSTCSASPNFRLKGSAHERRSGRQYRLSPSSPSGPSSCSSSGW